MKRVLIFLLALLLVPTVLAAAETGRVVDDSGLVPQQQIQFLEDAFLEIERTYGFTPAVATVDSFGGLSAEEYAGNFYDAYGYGYNGILYLVSLEEGQWYILTNGSCAQLIDNWEVQQLGEELAELLRQERYYDAFLAFGERSAALMQEKQEAETQDPQPQQTQRKPFGKTIFICMVVGLALGGIVVAVMAAKMKTVRAQYAAGDYVRPGSQQLTNSRDIFLYSRVHRTPRPKSNSSGGGSRGGSRGGAGGRI